MDHKSIVSEKENRALAAFPTLQNSGGRIDAAYIKSIPQSLDGYINDRFGFRNIFVSLANGFNKRSKTINGNVIIGKHEWLFYSKADDGNNIADFFKVNLFADSEVTRFIERIEKISAWCNDHNIKFLLLIAPNKHNVYPEYYPFDRPEGITRTEQIIAALPDHLKDLVIYPLDYIIQNKTKTVPLYFETDTHWNMLGAQWAFNLLFNRIRRLFPDTNFPNIQYVTDIRYDFAGDIVPMSGFTSYGKRTIPNVRPEAGWELYYHYVKNEGRNGENGVIIKNSDLSLPKAIIFRDSFFIALEPFTSSIFSSVEYNWRILGESEKDYIAANKPDILIWEFVERRIIQNLP